MVGGIIKGTITGELFSLVGEGSRQQWVSTKRWGVAAYCGTGKKIIDYGWERGRRNNNIYNCAKMLEVMNVDTSQWFTVIDLPQAWDVLCYINIVCNNYLLNCSETMTMTNSHSCRSVYRC